MGKFNHTIIKEAQNTEATFNTKPIFPKWKCGKLVFSLTAGGIDTLSLETLYLSLTFQENPELNNKHKMGKIYDKLIQIIEEPKTAFKADEEPNIISPKIKQITVVKLKAFKGTLNFGDTWPKNLP